MNFYYILNRLFFRLKNHGFLNTLRKIISFFFENKKINIDDLKFSNNEDLEKIFLRFGTDKANLDGKKSFYKIAKNEIIHSDIFYIHNCRMCGTIPDVRCRS